MRNFRSPSLSSFACKGKLFPRNVQIIGQKNGVKVLIMCLENLHSHHSTQHKDTKTRRLHHGIEDTKLAYGGLSLLWLLWLLGSGDFFYFYGKAPSHPSRGGEACCGRTPPPTPNPSKASPKSSPKGKTPSRPPRGEGNRWRSFRPHPLTPPPKKGGGPRAKLFESFASSDVHSQWFVFLVFFDVENFCAFRVFRVRLLCVLSEVFAARHVLATFFCRCGTLVHRRREMGLNRMAAGNQWVGKGRFAEGS